MILSELIIDGIKLKLKKFRGVQRINERWQKGRVTLPNEQLRKKNCVFKKKKKKELMW